MFANVSAMSSGGIRTTHFQIRANDKGTINKGT